MAGASVDPSSVSAATAAAFPNIYANSGLPAQFYPAAAAAQQQEGYTGDYGLTAGTAAQPGYGVAPLTGAAAADPAQRVAFRLKYLGALAKARGYDLTTPAGAGAALTYSNNGGNPNIGDPNYLQHVAARIPGVQVAQNGASDAPTLPAQGPAPDPQPAPSAAPQAPAPVSFNYSPPPLPDALKSVVSSPSGIGKSSTSRDLYQLAAGLLSGPTLGEGLGKGLAGVNQLNQHDQEQALEVYKAQQQTAQQGLLAQVYGARLGNQQFGLQTGRDNANTKALGEADTNNYHLGELSLGGGKLSVAQGGLAEKGRSDYANELLRAAAAQAANTRAGAAAAQAGSPVGAAPTLPPPPPGVAPISPGQPAPAAFQAASAGSSPVPPAAPSAAPAALPGGGAAGLPGASPWPVVGQSNVGARVGARGQNQAMQQNDATSAKETDADTGAIEAATRQNTLLDTQLALIKQQNQGALGTGGLAGRAASYLGSLTGDDTVTKIQKNAAALSSASLPHGVGALRLPEIAMATQQTPGMATSVAAAQHIRDQTVAQNTETADVLQARQAWIAAHPGQSAARNFDPIGNDYFRAYPAYTEQSGTAVATPRPSVLEFAQQRSKGGVYSPAADGQVQAAVSAAFPAASSWPPAGAVQMLRSNPSLAASFDAKYGAGTSAGILQGK